MQTTVANYNRVTLKDIARQLSVSHATVSLALRNSNRISPKRKEEIRSLAAKLGYTPDPLLLSLVAYRHKIRTPAYRGSLAWITEPASILSADHKREYNLCLKGAQSASEGAGFKIDELIWDKDIDAHRMEQILQTRQIRGTILLCHSFHSELSKFAWDKYNVIHLGGAIPVPHADIVSSDYAQSAFSGVSKLHKMGYCRIGIVLSEACNRAFMEGYNRASSLFPGLTCLHPLVLSELEDRSIVTFNEWLIENRPEALLTTDVRISTMLSAIGVRIPKDLAIASICPFAIPEIDAGSQHYFEEIGRTAAEIAIARVTGVDFSKQYIRHKVLISTTWRDGLSLPEKKRPKVSMTALTL